MTASKTIAARRIAIEVIRKDAPKAAHRAHKSAVGRTTSGKRTPGALHACWTLYDTMGVENLTVDMARSLAGSYGISPITAQIQFYKWRAARMG